MTIVAYSSACYYELSIKHASCALPIDAGAWLLITQKSHNYRQIEFVAARLLWKEVGKGVIIPIRWSLLSKSQMVRQQETELLTSRCCMSKFNDDAIKGNTNTHTLTCQMKCHVWYYPNLFLLTMHTALSPLSLRQSQNVFLEDLFIDRISSSSRISIERISQDGKRNIWFLYVNLLSCLGKHRANLFVSSSSRIISSFM